MSLFDRDNIYESLYQYERTTHVTRDKREILITYYSFAHWTKILLLKFALLSILKI